MALDAVDPPWFEAVCPERSAVKTSKTGSKEMHPRISRPSILNSGSCALRERTELGEARQFSQARSGNSPNSFFPSDPSLPNIRRVKNIAFKLPKRRTEQVLAVLGLMPCESHLVSHSLVSAGPLIHTPPTILIDTRVWSRYQRVGIRKAQVEASSGHRIKSSFAEAIRATVERGG